MDAPALHVLRVLDVRALGRRHLAVRLGAVLDALHVRLTVLEPRGLAGRQRAALRALRDARLLALLAMARYLARAPVTEGRLRYEAERAEVERVSDRLEGPYAGVHRMTALEFIARWVAHVPERYEVRVRYAGAYATRRRVWWRWRGVELARARAEPTQVPEAGNAWPALKARRRR
jgi:hypothetical protein